MRVRAVDFGVVAKMDRRCQLVLMATLLYQFVDTHRARRVSRVSSNSVYSGREDLYAKCLNEVVYTNVTDQPQYNKYVHNCLAQLFKKYGTPPDVDQESPVLMEARVEFFFGLEGCTRLLSQNLLCHKKRDKEEASDVPEPDYEVAHG